MANLVSIAKAREKGIELDTGRMCLYLEDFTVAYLTFTQNHFFMEYKEADDPPAVVSNVANRSLPASQWHDIFAHAGQRAIKALPQAVQGAVITDQDLTDHCDVCARTKAHQQISREMDPEESSTEAFFRVSFDLTQMTRANNGHQWITHLECASSKFTFAVTHATKDECTQHLLNIIQMIKTRFGKSVAFLRSDGEVSLTRAFKQQLEHQGVTHEVSAPYTPQQNGASERSGHSIIIKARALR
ncbi:Integrase catalytic core, partial [Macrophomina phaseolina MS6]